MKNRSLSPLSFGKGSLGKLVTTAIVLAFATLGLSSCHSNLYYAYKFPVYTYGNRPVPPSKLVSRVMVAIGNSGLAGSGGNLEILDSTRDIRFNITNTASTFAISGYAASYPTEIFNFPEEVHGYVYSSGDYSLQTINYSTEASMGSAAPLGGVPSSDIAIPTDGLRFFAAQPSTGQLVVVDDTTSANATYQLNLPNVDYVAANAGDTVALAMVKNSDQLYEVVKLNSNQYPTTTVAQQKIGAIDCQPFNVPVYCVVPVPGSYDRPIGAYFSLDGTTAYVINCGPECGGKAASITMLQQGVLNINAVADGTYSPASPTNPNQSSGFIANIPTPGGATKALSDGTNLYVAGQQLQPDGLFAGNLTIVNLASKSVTGTYSISDGYHTKMLFGDDNTLWIGSQSCATGERHKLGENYNCLTRFDLGAKTASIVPNVTPGGSTTVPYPNTNLDQYYYGDLTGLCWVQGKHKMYTAYGGQVHAFNTADGSEINNTNITVQGTALDVAYLDAATNDAN